MEKQINTVEDLVNIILGMNGPRSANSAPLQSGVILSTPFGKMSVRVFDFELAADDPTLKKLKAKSAQDITLEDVVRQTLGNYRDAYRRALSMCALVSGSVQAIKAENTTLWLLEGKHGATAPEAANKKWKVVAMVSFELPGEQEIELTIR